MCSDKRFEELLVNLREITEALEIYHNFQINEKYGLEKRKVILTTRVLMNLLKTLKTLLKEMIISTFWTVH